MNTCNTCKYWKPHVWYGKMDSNGHRPLTKIENKGYCEMAVDRGSKYTDRLICDQQSPDNQWGSGGHSPAETGAYFGCIHHDLK